MHWFTLSWYAYLFAPTGRRAERYCSNYWVVDRIARIWCRMRGHPAGQIWYNPGGLEPDDRCKNCGEYI
jgi:hypothetical protein